MRGSLRRQTGCETGPRRLSVRSSHPARSSVSSLVPRSSTLPAPKLDGQVGNADSYATTAAHEAQERPPPDATQAAAAAAASDGISGRQIEVVAAVSVVDSDSDTCDLSDLSISDDERVDNSNSVFGDRQEPPRVFSGSRSVSLLRQMVVSQQRRSNVAATSQQRPSNVGSRGSYSNVR